MQSPRREVPPNQELRHQVSKLNLLGNSVEMSLASNSRPGAGRAVSNTPRSAAKYPQLSILFTFIWVSGLFTSLLWSPSLVMDAVEQARLSENGKIAVGGVDGHKQGRRRNADYYTATVAYEVNSRIHHIQVQGSGASVERLPFGTAVNVLYLPTNPDFARVDLPGAASSRGPGWVGVGALWSLTLAGMLGALALRRRL